MADKFKRYGVPVRLENTPIFKERLDEAIALAEKFSGINGVVKDYDWQGTFYPFDDPSAFNEEIPTVGYVARMIITGPCLMEGTKITMADGTIKAVEECSKGDLVLSYDPASGKQTESVILDAYCTGIEHAFKIYVTESGDALYVYGNHGYYDTKAKCIRDISAKRTDAVVRLADGSESKVISVRLYRHRGDGKRRYNVITSNNLYYANGILCGHNPCTKYEHAKRRGIVYGDKIDATLSKECDKYNTFNDALNSPEYFKQTAVARAEYKTAYKSVLAKKADAVSFEKLGATDFLKIKDSVTDEIEKLRASYRAALETVKGVEKKLLGDTTEESLFVDACTLDNGLLEEYKEVLIPGYIKPIKKTKK